MDTITKYEALLGELEPYSPSSISVKKALLDAGVTELNSEYNVLSDKKQIALAAIKVLEKMTVLNSDSLGKSSQGYSVDKLEQRIIELCNDNGFNPEDFVQVSSITDGSNLW